MYLSMLSVQALRCFDEPQTLNLSKNINILVGPNNCGKSTLIRCIHILQQGSSIDRTFVRANADALLIIYNLSDSEWPEFTARTATGVEHRLSISARQNGAVHLTTPNGSVSGMQQMNPTYPRNFIVPYLAHRKTGFVEAVDLGTQQQVDGTLKNLYSRVDMLGDGHPDHDFFVTACKDIIGFQITAASSPGGKKAGFYFDRMRFINLDEMGDGVSNMLGLIVNLVTSKGRLFILEEPENDLHPNALKALLRLIDNVSATNQFIISTHSNIVARNLGAVDGAKIFRLARVDHTPQAPTVVSEVKNTHEAHHELLSELGYDFTDAGLWKGWLLLEESSAEEFIRNYLIPWFVGDLTGVLRTYSAKGVNNLPARVDDFNRIFVFLHLQPVYKDAVWIIADGDAAGIAVTDDLKKIYPEKLNENNCFNWSAPAFEMYFPAKFQEEVKQILGLKADAKKNAKQKLWKEVKEWIDTEPVQSKEEFSRSANELIKILLAIKIKLIGKS